MYSPTHDELLAANEKDFFTLSEDFQLKFYNQVNKGRFQLQNDIKINCKYLWNMFYIERNIHSGLHAWKLCDREKFFKLSYPASGKIN